MMKRYFKAKIKNGEFISNKSNFRRGVANMPDGDYIHLLIKTSDRTLRENQNYYYTQLGEWSPATGYTKAELHDIVKEGLFQELFNEPLSTNDLTEEDWTLVFFNLENFLLAKFENT